MYSLKFFSFTDSVYTDPFLYATEGKSCIFVNILLPLSNFLIFVFL